MSAADTDGPASELPDPGPARTLDELVGCLRALKLYAGDPSYETITRRVSAQWQAAGRPAGELARRGTVVDCFKTGRRRINGELMLAVVRALHDETGYLAHWRQALRVILAETAAAAQVRVLDRLPDDIATFTGRDAETAALRRLAGRPGPVVCVLAGMAGVGKSQLAIHAGRLLAADAAFDPILFVNLRGFHPDAGQPPAEPAAVLDGFLRVLGVSGHKIPHGLAARTALFRERLAGRRALVILDNAAGEDQVRPLLADAPGGLTLITSRRRLDGLDPKVHLDVELFSAHEAEQLLARSVPGVELGADDAAYGRVALRCGHLPLALSVVAGQMAARAGWTVTDHADRLDERHRHRRLDGGVELALHVSYRHLSERRRTLLRRMAAHPGPDLDVYAAAALLGTDPGTAAAHLRQLAGDNLAQQPVDGRYVLHDLVRAYAAERAQDEDRPADRRDALTRLFDHYVHGAAAAMDALYPAERHRRPELPPRPSAGPPLNEPRAALHWLDAERATLVAVCLQAARDGWPQHAVWLAGLLYSYLDNGGHPADAFAVHTEAQHAARLLGDGIAEATALTNLGVVCWQLGRHPEAVGHLSRALALFQQFGDARGEARTLGNLGVVHSTTGQCEISATYQWQALDRFVRLGDRVGEANTLTNLGSVHVRLGRPAPAVEQNGRALRIFRELEHRGGEATALNNLGDAHTLLGTFADAVGHYEQALTIFQDLGERYGRTCVLNGLGQALAGLGRRSDAVARHEEALALATEIDKPEEQARARAALARLAAET
ncbi:tetratricopeptide repeat protein [Paractinoplanes atraurantiacus]|uniref:NB-ARC domain-containing protein n=1 Tax=Paractinoplanes atraurantiacus TaxID=1036182 RepID=A0A285GPW0_9ACTN|nr:tetratricopeptide repeat protein [Actinoplanes atraurantiacus]SNY25254.1 NB-ARC domain-containing protein [Actinoplanes atraurantiacus]